MSSNEFKTIYSNAAAITKATLSAKKGIESLLDELGRRVPDEEKDPRQNRELFFEPRVDAQRIGVPLETAEAAAVLLHRIGVLRLWVRVSCPDAEDHEVGTILETDDPTEFEKLASTSCEVCGRHHDLGWENCETTYAICTRLDQKEQKFDFDRLISRVNPTQPLATAVTIPDQVRCQMVTERAKSDESPGGLLVLALKANQNIQEVPTPLSVWLNSWGGPAVILVLYFILIIPIAKLIGERLAWGVTVLTFGVIFLVIRGQVQAKLAPTAVQRTAMYLGFPISGCCFTAGATGLHISASAGEGQPWWSRIEFGEQSTLLITAGTFLFVATLFFVWGYDYSRGWLNRPS